MSPSVYPTGSVRCNFWYNRGVRACEQPMICHAGQYGFYAGHIEDLCTHKEVVWAPVRAPYGSSSGPKSEEDRDRNLYLFILPSRVIRSLYESKNHRKTVQAHSSFIPSV